MGSTITKLDLSWVLIFPVKPSTDPEDERSNVTMLDNGNLRRTPFYGNCSNGYYIYLPMIGLKAELNDYITNFESVFQYNEALIDDIGTLDTTVHIHKKIVASNDKKLGLPLLSNDLIDKIISCYNSFDNKKKFSMKVYIKPELLNDGKDLYINPARDIEVIQLQINQLSAEDREELLNIYRNV